MTRGRRPVEVFDGEVRVGQLFHQRKGTWLAFARRWDGLKDIGEYMTQDDAAEAVRCVARMPKPPEPIVGMEVMP